MEIEKKEPLPPCDELAERAILGSCLIDEAAIKYVADICSPADFYFAANRDIFDVMMALDKDGADIDAVEVSGELRRRGIFDKVGGASYLNTLADSVPIRSHVEQYARKVARCSQLRQTKSAATRLGVACQDMAADDDVEGAIETVRRAWEANAVTDATKSLRELVAMRFESKSEWLVQGWWLDQACGLLAAEEKSSKTTIALALGMCVAAGRPWLGKWPTRAGPVLALFEEDHERTIRRRAMLIGRALDIDPGLDNFHVLCQTGITIGGHRSRGRGRLAAMIRRHRPVLTILDPLRRMTPGVDENDSRAVSDYLGWLRRQQKENETAIMCLHHFAKEGKDDRVQRGGLARRLAHRVRGSSDFLAWYDSLVIVERRSEAEHRVNALHRGARPLDETAVMVEWHDPTDSIMLRIGGPNDIRQTVAF